MSKHEQVPYSFMVETRRQFRDGWRELDAAIVGLESAALHGARALRPKAATDAELLKHKLHDLILDELKFHLTGHGYKLGSLSDYATVACGSCLEINLLLPAESWQDDAH
jgi:hypothetical protein